MLLHAHQIILSESVRMCEMTHACTDGQVGGLGKKVSLFHILVHQNLIVLETIIKAITLSIHRTIKYRVLILLKNIPHIIFLNIDI